MSHTCGHGGRLVSLKVYTQETYPLFVQPHILNPVHSSHRNAAYNQYDEIPEDDQTERDGHATAEQWPCVQFRIVAVRCLQLDNTVSLGLVTSACLAMSRGTTRFATHHEHCGR